MKKITTDQIYKIHKVWHDFMKHFFDKRGQFKWSGYEMMCNTGLWAKKYPKDVFTFAIDDGCHASSDLVFILHRDKNNLWGVSIIVIPQCDGQVPTFYFMYPHHVQNIHNIFNKFLKMKRI